MAYVRGLPLLACAGFASMASMRMCDAMLPALAQAFDTRAADAATTISGFALAYGVMQFLYGPLGDRYGKQRVIATAAFGCALASAAAGLAPTLEWLTFGRVVMGGFAAGIIPLTMAWIGDRVGYDQRQETLARMLTWTVLGMMLGSWAGGALAETVGWRSAFLAASVCFLVPTIGILRFSDEGVPRPSASLVGFVPQVMDLWRSPWTRQVLAVVFIEGATVFGALAFVPTALHERLQLSLLEAGAVLALFGFGGLVYSRVAGRWVRRLGAPLLAGIGACCLALSFALLATMWHWVVASIACFLAGLGFYMLHNTLQTCATQLSTSARGTAVSLFVSALFLGQASGVTLASALARSASPTIWFVAAVPVLLVLGLYFSTGLRHCLSLSGAAA